MSEVTVDHAKCEGPECGEYVDLCPMEILVIDGEQIKVQNPEECNECEVCIDVCPKECIKIN
ncbi:MAG: 4Fe-4S binding protein [Methanobacteriaceae archaeon]|nr:4Fe-4S binding protein [Methanobacteriaceae archaeon]